MGRLGVVHSPQRGQSTVEWIGLLGLVGLMALAGLAAIGVAAPGTSLAAAIGDRIICLARAGDGCGSPADQVSELEKAFGPSLAATVVERAPRVLFESGEPSLPVDFRSCREHDCADVEGEGEISRSATGEQATSFVHVIDCRAAEPIPAAANCAGVRAGNLYLQYWLYYPDSQTDPFGSRGYHLDDWESYQVRIALGGVQDRASSHHSYNHAANVGSLITDTGIVHKAAWGDANGYVWVSKGSHAGRSEADGQKFDRWVDPENLRLIPIDPYIGEFDVHRFATTSAWNKRVFLDPEEQGTG